MKGYVDNKNFDLIDFIKTHDDWEKLLKEKPYNLKSIKNCFWHQDWYMFVYNLFSSELTNPVVRNCRGTVLSIDGKDVKPISVPYTKFFNYSGSDKLISIGEPSGIDDWEEI